MILVTNTNGTYNLEGLSLTELQVIYHCVNNCTFTNNLPSTHKQAAAVNLINTGILLATHMRTFNIELGYFRITQSPLGSHIVFRH